MRPQHVIDIIIIHPLVSSMLLADSVKTVLFDGQRGTLPVITDELTL